MIYILKKKKTKPEGPYLRKSRNNARTQEKT